MDDKELEQQEIEEEITVDYILTELKKRTDKNQPNMLLAYMDFVKSLDIEIEDKKERKKYLPDPILNLLKEDAIRLHLITEEAGDISKFI